MNKKHLSEFELNELMLSVSEKAIVKKTITYDDCDLLREFKRKTILALKDLATELGVFNKCIKKTCSFTIIGSLEFISIFEEAWTNIPTPKYNNYEYCGQYYFGSEAQASLFKSSHLPRNLMLLIVIDKNDSRTGTLTQIPNE